MGRNERIAKNTIMMFVRMIGVMLINLYASRLILQILGVTDYGIYNVVAGFVVIFSFLDVSISNAAQRYISIGLGKKDESLTKHYFEQSFTILCYMALLMVILVEIVGILYIKYKLVVPIERHNAAFWVFHFSVVSVVCSVIRIIFIADIVAREKLNAYAYFSIFETAGRWLILYVLLVVNSDKLIFYAFLRMILSLLFLALYALYSKKFSEFSLHFTYDKKLLKEMSSFIGLTTFGGFSYTIANQGINIILNLFYGPVANAARGIASQTASIIGRLNTSVAVPIRPAMIKAYAEEDFAYVRKLLLNSSKYTFCLLAIVSFTFIGEMELILNIWLGQVPEYASNFCRLAILDQLVLALVAPLASAANATGKIKHFEFYGRIITLMSLPISYIILRNYSNAYIPMIVLVVCDIFFWIYCLRDISKRIQLKNIDYIRAVILPCIIITFSLLFTTLLLTNTIKEDSFIRFLYILIINSLIVIIWLYIFSSKQEKIKFKLYCNKIKGCI